MDFDSFDMEDSISDGNNINREDIIDEEEDDYYTAANEEFSKTSAFPTITCPTMEDLDENKVYKGEMDKKDKITLSKKFIYISESQAVTSLHSCYAENFEINEDSKINPIHYTVTKKNSDILIPLIKDSNFSKENNRMRIYNLLKIFNFSDSKFSEAK